VAVFGVVLLRQFEHGIPSRIKCRGHVRQKTFTQQLMDYYGLLLIADTIILPLSFVFLVIKERSDSPVELCRAVCLDAA
jgi:hypothetical protein